jgi:hypothetical protein
MKIDDLVTWKGRAYVLRGFDPIGVPDQLAQLEESETGDVITAPLSEVTCVSEASSEEV